LGQPLHLGRKNKRLKQALKIKIIYITATIKAPGSGRLLIFNTNVLLTTPNIPLQNPPKHH
jgi:hypothetical protein